MQVTIGTSQIEPSSLEITLPSRECLSKGFCLRLKKSVVRIEFGSVVPTELVEGQLIYSPVGHLMRERFKLFDIVSRQHRVDAHERFSIESKFDETPNNMFEAVMRSRHGSQHVVGVTIPIDTKGDFIHASGDLPCDAGILQGQAIGGSARFQS